MCCITQTKKEITITIHKRILTVDWNDTFTYDGTAKLPIAENIGNLAFDDDAPELTLDGAQTDVGSYTATVTGISNKNYDKGDLLIKIDHHPDVDPYADMSYVDPDAPAASEIIFDFLKAENLPITKEVAAALYAGIVGDTGRFMYPETSAHTFDVAAELTKTGINITDIAREIADVTFDEAKLQALAMDKMEIDPVGAAYTILMQDDLKKMGLTDDQANVAVSTPGRIKDVLAWNVFVEKPDGTFRVHYRSKGPVINHLAEQHDGGGHALASGANAKDMDEVKQVFNEVVEVTKKYKEEHGTNK